MIPAKKFETWKAQAAVTLPVIPGVAILGEAILEAAIQVVTQEVAIPVAATQGAILRMATPKAIPAGYLAEVTQGAQVEGPPGEGRTLKATPKCSR
jgi:hypothetical protein